MFTIRTRRRWWLLGAIATALVVSLAALLLRSMLEHAVRARIESAAVRHGMVARIGLVHVGVWPLLRLEGFDLDLGHGVRLHADMIAATWPGRLRLAVRAATLEGPAGVRVSSPATAWDLAGGVGGGPPVRRGRGPPGAPFAALGDTPDEEPKLGPPTGVTLRFDGAWRRAEGTIEIPE